MKRHRVGIQADKSAEHAAGDEKEELIVRFATETDLPAIVAIYNTTVPTRQSTADTAEVSVASRMEWFRQHTPGKRPLLVHERDGRIIAWVSFQSFYGRPAYAADQAGRRDVQESAARRRAGTPGRARRQV